MDKRRERDQEEPRRQPAQPRQPQERPEPGKPSQPQPQGDIDNPGNKPGTTPPPPPQNP